MRMKLKSIMKRETATARELNRHFASINQKNAILLDKKIKKMIDNDDSDDKIDLYVQQVLKGEIVKKRHSFSTSCASIANKYKENNGKLIEQENLFCFFALIVSILSMIFTLISKITSNETLPSDITQFVLYGFAFLAFFFVERNEWLYSNKKFSAFLKILNKYAPTLIMLSSFLFYFSCVFFNSLVLKYCFMGLFSLLPLLAIAKTKKKLK